MQRDTVIYVVMDGTNNIPVKSFYNETAAIDYINILKQDTANRFIRYWQMPVPLTKAI